MTRLEARFIGTVKETNSLSCSVSKAYRRTARAPSVANPWFQFSADNLQPISTQGVNFAVNCGTASPNEANEGARFTQLSGKQAKAVFPKMLLDSIHERVTFFVGETLGHEFHHSGIGIQCGEWFPIGVPPIP